MRTDLLWAPTEADPGSPEPLPAHPVPVVREFPRSGEVPEGCLVIDDLAEDEFGYPVNMHQEIYVTREVEESLGGGAVDLPMWVFTPRLDDMPVKRNITSWPAIVFVRGSGWGPQMVTDYLNYYVRLAERGYVVVALQYRHSGIAPFPAQMQDCKTAIRYVRKHAERLHINPDRVALWGDSSGGCTVLQAGFTADSGPDTPEYGEYSAAVSCIVDWYGPADIPAICHYPSVGDATDPKGPVGMMLGGHSLLDVPELAYEASPINYLKADVPTPPTLIMHGGRDQDVPFNQSCRLYRRMKELGKDVSFIKLNDGTHGYYGFRTKRAMDIIDMYLQSHL